jgi:hypothetical protein
LDSPVNLTTSSLAPLTRQSSVQSEKSRTFAAREQFTREELAQIAELKRRDREVRAHEQAHLAAAGQYAKSGPQYTYQKGPDGKNYAVGGEVQIDASPVRGDPEATLRKAEQVRRAANAPASPSSQDRSVAADAAAIAIQARIELAKEQQAQEVPAEAAREPGNLVNNDLLSMTYSAENRESGLLDMMI